METIRLEHKETPLSSLRLLWIQGENDANQPMYSPRSGISFDGINRDKRSEYEF